MKELKSLIRHWLAENRSEAINLLQQMVQAPSTQGNEACAQAIIATKLQQLGLEVDIWEPNGEELTKHPFFNSLRNNFVGSPNVVAVWKGTGGGRSLLLNGHIDVVPAGDHTQWNDDPFSGKIEDGRMYGRGVTDMKGGCVSLLLAVEAIKRQGIRLKGDLLFHSVVEEESGGAGTLAAILRGYAADAAIIPEPTNMKIFPKQQGSMWFRICVKGRSAHGGTRYEGVSAIEKSMIVVAHVLALEKERNQRITDLLYANTPIPIPINLGVIQGGSWPSSVPDQVTLEGRMGVAPAENLQDAKQELSDWLAKLQFLDPWFEQHPVTLEWFGARWVPGAVEHEHELMNILISQYREVLSKEPLIEASPWGTDGGLLQQVANTPTIVFGPGTTEVAHFPNEYIVLERVFQAAEIIACTILDWCEVA